MAEDFFEANRLFHQRLTEKANKYKFFDYAAEQQIRPENEDYPNPTPAKVHPFIELCQGKKKKDVLGNVLHITNFLSPEFLDEIIKEEDCNKFCIGKGGKQKAYTRIINMEGTPETTPMVIGQQIYTGVGASAYENKLFRIIKWMTDLSNQCIDETMDTELVDVDYFNSRLAHCLVGQVSNALYKRHSDANSKLLIRSPHQDKIELDDGHPLPSKTTMIVPTVIIQPCDTDSPTTEIRWYADRKKNQQVGSVRTFGNDLHLQLHGCNESIQHEVAFIKGSLGNFLNAWRMVLTFRHSMVANTVNKDRLDEAIKADMGNVYSRVEKAETTDEYLYSNVISAIEKGVSVFPIEHDRHQQFPERYGRTFGRPCSTEQKDSDDTGNLSTDVNLGLPQFKDRFRKIPNAEWDSLGFVRPDITFGEIKSNWKTMSSAEYTRQLLIHKVLCYRKSEPNNENRHVGSKIISSLFMIDGKPLMPLQIVLWTTIATQTNIDWVDKDHPIASSDPFSIRTLNLTQLYKNDVATIRDVIMDLETKRNQCSGGGEDAIVCSCKEIRAGESGGSMVKAGNYQPTLKTATKNDPTYTIMRGQDDESAINSALASCWRRGGILAVFVDYNTFYKRVIEEEKKFEESRSQMNLQCKENTHAVFLGYGQIMNREGSSGMSAEELDKYVTNQPYPPSPNDIPGWSQYSYMLQSHHVLVIRFIFDEQHYKLLQEFGKNPVSFKQFTVHENDNIPLTYNGIRSIDHKYAIPDTRERCTFHMKQCIWTRFSQRDENEKLMPVSGEEMELDLSFTVHSIRDFVDVITFICVSDAIRAQRDTVLREDANGQKWAYPLIKCPRHNRLGTALQLSPLPNPMRDLNPVPLLLRAQAYRDYGPGMLKFGDRISSQDMTNSGLEDLFFQAILLRCTGRVKVFYDCWFCHFNNGQGDIIPSRAIFKKSNTDPRSFENFVRYTVKDQHGKMRNWISEQHKGAIPHEMWDVGNFFTIFRTLADNMTSLCTQILDILEKDEASTTRCKIREILEDELLNVINGSKDRRRVSEKLLEQCQFLSCQWMADIESIVKGDKKKNTEFETEFFGDMTVEAVFPGIGGKEGFGLLERNAEAWAVAVAEPTTKDNVAKLTQYRKIMDRTMKDLCHFVHNVLEDKYLPLLFCRRRKDGMVVLIINGIPFNYYHAEHWACKIKILLAMAHQSRYAERPEATKHYCRPFPFDNEAEAFAPFYVQMQRMFTACINKFDSLPDHVIPEVALSLQELEQLAQE